MRWERTGYETECYESHRRDERGESDSLRTEAVNPEGQDHGKTKDEGKNKKSIEPVKTVREFKWMQRRTGWEEDTATAGSTWVSTQFDHCQGACNQTEGCTGKEQELGSKDKGCDVDAIAERRREMMVLNMSQGAQGREVDDDRTPLVPRQRPVRGKGEHVMLHATTARKRGPDALTVLRRPTHPSACLRKSSKRSPQMLICHACFVLASIWRFHLHYTYPPFFCRGFPRWSLRRGKARQSERNGPEERGWRAGLTYNSGFKGESEEDDSRMGG
ncbi:hypothetical protein C8Q74DRAFT_1221920 [Fomes fomentarius]|nr:hypothetical protein C8Q74DRAFT_1221920 [Fomes fomentarius]